VKKPYVPTIAAETENAETSLVSAIWDTWELIVPSRNVLEDAKMVDSAKMDNVYVLLDSPEKIVEKNCVLMIVQAMVFARIKHVIVKLNGIKKIAL